MRVLLDSNVFLWAATGARGISTAGRAVLSDTTNERLLSSVTPWELGIKFSRNKLDLPSSFLQFIRVAMSDLQVTELPVSIVHALKSAELPLIHGDPFDRMLVAQCQCDSLTLVTADRVLHAYDVDLVDARL